MFRYSVWQNFFVVAEKEDETEHERKGAKLALIEFF